MNLKQNMNLKEKYIKSQQKSILHRLPVQCALEMTIYRVIENVLRITNPTIGSQRIAKVAVILVDLILMIIQNASLDNFTHRLNRHMILGILLEIQTASNKRIIVCRSTHHILTMYINHLVKNKSLVRDSIQVIELANLFSVPIFYQSIAQKSNQELTELFHKNRLRAQLISRLYVLVNAILSLALDDYVYMKREMVIFALLQIIGIQEIFFAYKSYQSVKQVKVVNPVKPIDSDSESTNKVLCK